ncbi:MAG: hypothetical protein ACR2GY_02215 [Phycisphaerales bacterium]
MTKTAHHPALIIIACLCGATVLCGCQGSQKDSDRQTIRLDVKHGEVVDARSIGRKAIEQRLYTPPPNAERIAAADAASGADPDNLGNARPRRTRGAESLPAPAAPATVAFAGPTDEPLYQLSESDRAALEAWNSARARDDNHNNDPADSSEHADAGNAGSGDRQQPDFLNRGRGSSMPSRNAATHLPERPLPAPPPTAADAAAFDGVPQPAAGPGAVWAVLLASAAGENHQLMARQQANVIARDLPQVRGMWLHETERGSMLLVGQFQTPDDANAQSLLAAVKAATLNGVHPFERAYLVRIEPQRQAGQAHPHDLRTLRQQFPNVRPLYTLQVAAWIELENDERVWASYRKAAETYTARLRAAGHEAWFYHDDQARTTQVTVGKFDRRAIDSRSGLYSADARRVIAQFPVHLVNGEEVLQPSNPKDPRSKLQTQEPFMVEVPTTLN